MNIKTNGTTSYAFYIYDSNHNFTIQDSILNSSYAGVREVYVRSAVTGGEWNFTNVTRANGNPITINWTIGGNGTLNMGWYLDVNVTNSSGAVENVNVSVWNKNNDFQFSVNTTTSGFIPKQTLLEYTNVNNTLITYYSNYTVNTIKTGYATNLKSVNMSGNKRLDVILNKGSGPKIIWVQKILDVTPLLGGKVNVNFNFTVYDLIGYTDLNDSSAKANFSKIGYEQSRANLTCLRITSQSSGNYANYTCTVEMLYFDEGGDWNISVSIEDNSKSLGINDSTIFHYNYLTAVSNPSLLNWGILAPGEINKPVNNNPIIANNTGNVDIPVIKINGTNLVNGTYSIGVGNFSVNTSDGGGNGALLIDGLAISVINSSLPSKNSTSSGERSLYFYIKQVPYGLPSKDYQTDPSFPWIIGFAVLISVNTRKKKKKINIPLNIFRLSVSPAEALCKYLKENKGLSVGEIAKLINRDKSTVSINYKNAVKNIKEKIKEIKEKTKEDENLFVDVNIFSNRKLSILESLVSRLKKKGYRNIEIANLLNKDQRNISTLYSRVHKKLTQRLEDEKIIFIPVTIFKQEISPAEALYKYLRESKKLKFSQIAELTNRSESTIWTEYHNSINKKSEIIKGEQTELHININIFSNRKLSILESLVSYLKKKGYRNIEIAKLLNKDQRNISTLYSRFNKKSKLF
jgi:DNA-binding NarL/FixJ family response regulator